MNPKLSMALRVLLGLFFLIFGVNKFLNFLPPFPSEGMFGELMGIFVHTGFLKLIAVLEILIGLALLTGKFVPLALIFAVAIMFNAAVFHLLLDPGNVGGALVGLILSLVNIYANKPRFLSILSP